MGLRPLEQALPPPAPLALFEATATGGERLVLCDFASAGGTGNFYASWLPARGADPASAGPFGAA